MMKLLRVSLPFVICLLFISAYTILSFVRHDHYQSFGYDLGINDQTVWRYSHFEPPVTTIDPFPDKTKLYEHVELVYALISPFYWIWESRKMLLLLQAAFVCSGGIAVYLLAKKKRLSEFLSLSILVGYLGFFGVQNALWFDAHSITFGAAFLAWFLYFLDSKKKWGTSIFFLLAITSKENVAFYTFAIALVYFIRSREKLSLSIMFFSVVYLLFIFEIYFPHIIHFRYLYQNSGGMFSNLNPISLFDSKEKIQAITYSLLSFGFIPLFMPLYLLPVLAHFVTFFVIASDLPGAQGLYGQYRITLAPFLSWATIMIISKNRKMQNKYIGLYILFCVLFVQYSLHLPLSYLSKSWFWKEPSGVENIQKIRFSYLPLNASVVAQNNIVSHISHRDKIYSLYPEKKYFKQHSPCGDVECNWFRWFDHPDFLFVDTSPEWDARHLLENREDFIDGIHNLEKAGVIKKYKQEGSAVLYKVVKKP